MENPPEVKRSGVKKYKFTKSKAGIIFFFLWAGLAMVPLFLLRTKYSAPSKEMLVMVLALIYCTVNAAVSLTDLSQGFISIENRFILICHSSLNKRRIPIESVKSFRIQNENAVLNFGKENSNYTLPVSCLSESDRESFLVNLRNSLMRPPEHKS